MARIAFIGLGNMGSGMAANLVKAGHEVHVYDLNAQAVKALEDKGAVGAASLADAVRGAKAVVTMLPAGKHVRSVYEGEDGIINLAETDAILMDCSTIDVDSARAVAAEADRRGMAFVDAPVSGGVAAAEGGTLTFMVGGPKEVFDRVRPFYDPMGANFYYCGTQGMGLHAKLSQNLVLANMLQGFVEGMVLATKAGVDPKLMFEVLDNSAAKAGLISFKAPQIFKRNFEAAFPLKWMKKDISLMLDSGRELGVPLPCTALVHEMFTAGVARGHGDEDIAAAIKLFEEFAGVEVKG